VDIFVNSDDVFFVFMNGFCSKLAQFLGIPLLLLRIMLPIKYAVANFTRFAVKSLCLLYMFVLLCLFGLIRSMALMSSSFRAY